MGGRGRRGQGGREGQRRAKQGVYGAAPLVFQFGGDLILKRLAPHGLAAIASARGVATLNHEVAQQPVESHAVVVAAWTYEKQ